VVQRTPTSWQNNPDKDAGVAYSSLATAYSSSSTSYSSADASLDEYGKLPEAWSKQSKTARVWQVNPASDTNLYAYGSASHTYDSAVDTYDGIVSGQEFNDIKTASAWRSL
jgi:hypothetical protein